MKGVTARQDFAVFSRQIVSYLPILIEEIIHATAATEILHSEFYVHRDNFL